MSHRIHCDRDDCDEWVTSPCSVWWTVSTEEVIGGCSNGRLVEQHFCSKKCLAIWASTEVESLHKQLTEAVRLKTVYADELKRRPIPLAQGTPD